MKMSKTQSELVELVVELEAKTKEYKNLCEELESFKKQEKGLNDSEYCTLATKFLENYRAINEINAQLKILKKRGER